VAKQTTHNFGRVNEEEINDKSYKLYCYWEGGDRHWFYDLCWQTTKRHNPDAVLIGREDVQDLFGPLPKVLEKAYLTHRVDWIRKKFISTVGGAWVDMDYICWSDLSWLTEMARGFDFVGYKEWGGGWMDNFFAGRSGSKVIRESAGFALDALNQKDGAIGWLEAATDAVRKSLDNNGWGQWIELPTHLVTPINCMDVDMWGSGGSDDEVGNYNSWGVIASRHALTELIDRFDGPDDLLASDTRLGACLRRGLGLPPISQ